MTSLSTLPSGWREVTLGELSHRVTKGTTPTTLGGRYTNRGIAFVKVESITDDGRIEEDKLAYIDEETNDLLARSSLQRDDVLFTIAGTIGRVGRVQETILPANTNQAVAIVRPDQRIIESKYLYYSLRDDTRIQRAHSRVVQSVQANFSLSELSAIEIPLPPLEEQREIAGVLGAFDDKIELNRRMNETLEAMARALFTSWFVDFEPVRAKMEGRWHHGESLPGLLADLWDLFPDRLVPSQLGEIPEGWDVKPLREVVRLNPREPMKRGTLAPYLDMAALPTSGSSPDSPVLREYKSGTRFRNGDTLLARITPCLENGKTAFVQSLVTGTVGWGSTEFIVLRTVPPVPPEYTYLLARDDGFREHAIQSMTGTSGRQRVQVDALAPYPLPSPPAEFWNKFSALVSPLFAQIEVSRTESHVLATQRDALLPRLVSGEVRV